jgi:hypothetical protein
MKKLILLTIFIFSFLTNVQAQESDTLKTTIYKDVKSAITQLADALKVGAEHVYGILVKQQVVNSITNLIVYIVLISVTIALYILARKIKNESEYSDDDSVIMINIVATLLVISDLIYLGVTIQATVTGFVNPEYGAIQEIMSLIR